MTHTAGSRATYSARSIPFRSFCSSSQLEISTVFISSISVPGTIVLSTASSCSSGQNMNLSVIQAFQRSRLVEESPKEYDVFINHRGPDVKETLALELYSSLNKLEVQTFLDSQEREIGCSFPSTITTAIRSASVHVAIFSPGYAGSTWCLDELLLMLDTTAMIVPVFYGGVQPSDLRYVEKGKYADAFMSHIQKGRHSEEKLEAWKKALKNESLTAGFESSKYKNDNCLCEVIVLEVKKELERKAPEYVAEHSVGLDNLVEDFESLYQERKEKEQANILGIVGMGGIGKSTLAREFFNRKRLEYHGACFLPHIREASKMGKLPSLQRKLLKDLLRQDHREFGCREEGISYLVECFKSVSKRFLIVLDDIDHLDQLEAFPIIKKLGNSLAIVTTRDEGVLKNARISIRYKLEAMDEEHGSELFCWHAFGQRHVTNEYEEVVKAFILGCRGLPLYLRVLGRHISGRNLDECWRALKKYESLLHGDIKDSLKISLEKLDREEENIFIDMACFFVDKPKSMAIRVWEGSGWNAHCALERLKEKGLVEEIEYRWNKEPVLTMHDLLRDLGRERANELQSPRRLWNPDHLRHLESMGFQEILRIGASANWRCFQSLVDSSMGAKITYFIANSDDVMVKPASLLWLELDFSRQPCECIPPWIPLKELQFLKIMNGYLKMLWKNDVQAPSKLRELQVSQTIFLEGPDLLVMKNNLEKILVSIDNMTIEGWSLLESLILSPKCLVLGHTKIRVEQESCGGVESATFKSLSSSIYNLSNVRLKGILDLNNRGQSHTIEFPMRSLEKLEIFSQHLITKVLVSGSHYPNIKSLVLKYIKGLIELDLKMVKTLNNLELTNCKTLKIVSGICDLSSLVTLNIDRCPKLKELPSLAHLTALQTVAIGRCEKLNRLELDTCENLKSVILRFMKSLATVDLKRVTALNILQLNDCQNCKSVSGISDLANLVTLNINQCSELEELPCLSDLSCLQTVTIGRCEKLNSLELHKCENLKSVSVQNMTIEGWPFLESLNPVSLVLGPSKLIVERASHRNGEAATLKSYPSSIYHLSNVRSKRVLDLENKGQCPDIECSMENLQKLQIFYQQLVTKVLLNGCHYLHIKSLVLTSMKGLIGLDLKIVRSLNNLELTNCKALKSVSGISDLTNLITLTVDQCPELEELPCLANLSCLQTVTIGKCDNLKCLELHACENLKSVILSSMENLLTVDLKRVAALNILQLNDCQNCKSVSGISDLANLVTLSINQCSELEELSGLAELCCLQTVTIGSCEKLNCLELPRCEKLKSVSLQNVTIEGWSFLEYLNPESLVLGPYIVELVPCRSGEEAFFKTLTSSICNWSNIRLRGILDLKKRGDSPNAMYSLQKLKIFDQNLVTKVLVSGCHYPHLKSLVLTSMEGLIELDLKMVNSLNNLELSNCEILISVSGISDLANLVTLNIDQCSALEELPCLAHLSCLQTLTIGKCEKLNRIELHTCENLKSVVLSSMENLLTVDLKRVAALNILQLNDCQNCKSVSGISDLANLVTLSINQCSELEELSGLAELCCLQTVTIGSCEKLNCLELPRCEKLKSVSLQNVTIEGWSFLEYLNPESLVLGPYIVELVPCRSGEEAFFKTLTSSICNWSNIRLRGILDLKKRGDSPNAMYSLQKLKIFDQNLVTKVLVSGCHYPHLKSLVLTSMEGLIELDLKMVNSLNNLELSNCEILISVSGISDLANLVTLNIDQCSALEELPCLAHLSCLQTLTIGKCEKLNRIELHTCENLKSVVLSSMENLLTVNLKRVPALNSLQLNDCQNCKSVPDISDLANLVTLNINQCSELEELSGLSDLSCLETVTISGCEKLTCLDLHRCKNLKSVNLKNVAIDWPSFLEPLNPEILVFGPSKLIVERVFCRNGEAVTLKSLPSSIYNLSNGLKGILDLEKRGQSPNIGYPMYSLQKLEIFCQHLVTKVLVSGHHYSHIKSLVLTSMDDLIELDLKMVKTLNNLEISNCKTLKRVSGISDLVNLATLSIDQCSELEELPCIACLSCLQTVRIAKCEKLNRLVLHVCENLKSVVLISMENLLTVDLKRVSALNSLHLIDCQNFKSVSGISDLANLVTLNINQCSELEELPCLSNLSCLQTVTISRCKKLNRLELHGCENLKSVSIQNMTLEGWSFLESFNPESLYLGPCKLIIERASCRSVEAATFMFLPSSIYNLSNVGLRGILDFKKSGKSPNFGCPMNSLKKLEIVCQHLVTKVLVSGYHYPHIKYLLLTSMEGLIELDLKMVKSLNTLKLWNCKTLRSVSGISDLANLVTLYIIQCTELEELPCLADLSCLQTVRIGGCEKLKRLELHMCKNLKSVVLSFMKNLLTVDLKRVSALQNLELSNCQNCKSVSGISDLSNLVTLNIIQCSELEELPCLSELSYLQTVVIGRCEKLNRLELHRCGNLKSLSVQNMTIEGWSFLESLNPESLVLGPAKLVVELASCTSGVTTTSKSLPSSIYNLSNVRLRGILDLKRTAHCPNIGGPFDSLQKLEIFDQHLVTKLLVNGCHYLHIKSLVLTFMEGLIELDLKMVKSLNNLNLSNCKALKGVSGITDLANLVTLSIYQCSELEALPCLADLSCLQTVTISKCEKLNHLELHTCKNLESVALSSMGSLLNVDLKSLTALKILELNDCPNCKNVSGVSDLTNLVTLNINQCSELEDLPCLANLSCLQTITIGRCIELHKCENLSSVSRSPEIEITKCLELQEMPNLECLEQITSKLQDISGIEELPALRILQLLQCSNAVIRNLTHRLQRVPLEYLVTMGSAVDGVKSTLQQHFFYDCIGNNAIIQINVQEHGFEYKLKLISEHSLLSAIIVCTILTVDSANAPEFIQMGPSPGPYQRLDSGDWIVTTVITDQELIRHYLEDFKHLHLMTFLNRSTIENVCMVMLKKGEESKILPLVKMIMDRLLKE